MASLAIPATQRMWRAHNRGTPRDVLRLDEVPVPSLKPGQVLVKVEAAALNPVGYKMMWFLPNIFAKRPCGVEHDFAGTIVSTSPQTSSSSSSSKSESRSSNLEIGQKVWGVVLSGAVSEYVAADAENVQPVPSGTTIEEASGMGVVGLTGLMILDHLKPKAGDNIFVIGGSSSVGAYTIQMLKEKGCKVAASSSGKNIDLVKSFGADEVFDYTKTPIPQQLRERKVVYDGMADCIGQDDVWRNCTDYLRPGGVYSVVANGVESYSGLLGVARTSLSAKFLPGWLGGIGGGRVRKPGLIKPDPVGVRELNRLAELGIKPRVDSTHKFVDALNAYDRIMSHRATGKVVITIP